MQSTRDEVKDYIMECLEKTSSDWDDPVPITPHSLMFTELGFESLDAVILGITIQEHFGEQLPFAELFAELGENRRDLSVSQLIDFVHQGVSKG